MKPRTEVACDALRERMGELARISVYDFQRRVRAAIGEARWPMTNEELYEAVARCELEVTP